MMVVTYRDVTMKAAKRYQEDFLMFVYVCIVCVFVCRVWPQKELGQNLNVTIEKKGMERLSDHACLLGDFGVTYIKRRTCQQIHCRDAKPPQFHIELSTPWDSRGHSEAERSIFQNHMKS